MLTIIVTLAVLGVGVGLFWLGRLYEARRVAALIAWACSLAGEMQVSMAALEAEKRGAATTEQSEQRVH